MFGPKPRNYRIETPKNKRRQALSSALSDAFKRGNLIVVDAIECSEPKTKRMAEILNGLDIHGKTLIVLTAPSKEVYLSVRNLANVRAVIVDSLHVVDVLAANTIIIEQGAIEKLERRLS